MRTMINHPRTLLLLFFLFTMSTSLVFSKDYYVKDYGAIGDGTTNDLPAIRSAIAAFINDATPSNLYFEANKVYRCIPTEEEILFNMLRIKNKTVIGNGAEILGDVDLLGARLNRCDDIEINGLTFDYNTLSWTQGKVTSVDRIAGNFIMEVEEGYPIPAEYSEPQAENPWGMIWGPTGYEIKNDLVWIDQCAHMGGRSVKFIVKESDKYKLDGIEINDRFTLDVVAKRTAFNFIINSKNITFRNCTYYSGRAQGFVGKYNTGKLHLDGVAIRRRPGTTRLVSVYRGGFIWSNNRMGPIIENCHIEGICDDGINMYSYYAYVNEKIANNQFKLHKTTNMEVGDTLVFVNMMEGRVIGRTHIASINDNDVTTISNISNVVAGESGAKTTTYVMNLNISCPGFEIRNSIFKDYRRFAVLTRARDGIIENNTGDNLGCGIGILNEVVAFEEGPFPGNITVRGNTMTNIRRWPLRIHAGTWASTPEKLISDIIIENNTFESITDGEYAAGIRDARNIEFINNKFTDNENEGILVVSCEDITFACDNTLNNADITTINDGITIRKTLSSDIIFDFGDCNTSAEQLNIKENQLFTLTKEGDLLKISTNIKNYKVCLYDINGCKMQNTFMKNENTLDVSNMVPGIYLVHIFGNGHKQVSKIKL